jgi:hypothetical protein
VNSAYESETDAVASFEKLIGCHGGFGGPQTRPFLIVPSAWDVGPAPLVGGEALNAILRRAIAIEQAGAAPTAGGPTGSHAPIASPGASQPNSELLSEHGPGGEVAAHPVDASSGRRR